MNCLGRVVLILMLLLLVRHLLLMLVLVAMMLMPTTPLSHLLWSLLCSLCLQLLMSSTRASPMTRSSCLHKFCKERTRSPKGCFECSDTTHFIAGCPKRKKINSSNKYDYIKRHDYSRGDDKKKYHVGDKKKKKKF
jgi:hypothetical protein